MKNVYGLDQKGNSKKIIRRINGKLFYLMKESQDGQTKMLSYHDATDVVETWFWMSEDGNTVLPYSKATDSNVRLFDSISGYITKPFSPWIGCHWSHSFGEFTETGCTWTHNRPIGD